MSSTPSDDFGYNDSSLIWSFTTSHLGIRSTSFAESFDLVGQRAITLLNAAKRLWTYSAPGTIESGISAVRCLCIAIAAYAPKSDYVFDWESALVSHLRSSSSSSNGAYYSYKTSAAVLMEVARAASINLRTRNPFTRRPISISPVRSDALKVLLRDVREDVLLFHSHFSDSSTSPFPDLIAHARQIAVRNGGLLPKTSRRLPNEFAFSDFLSRRVGPTTSQTGRKWKSRDIARHFYATLEALAPFFILLIYKLAGNVDAVTAMRRDCMREIIHPIHGPRFLITVDKGRSEAAPPYSVSDYGTLSVPWIVRSVLDFTEPLLPFAEPEHRHFLFISLTRRYNVVPFVITTPNAVLQAYKAARAFPYPLTLNQLRPTRLVDEYVRSKDPFRVKRIARHASLKYTIPYLDHVQSEIVDDIIIADAQRALLEPPGKRKSQEDVKTNQGTSLGSHSCTDPFSPEHGLDANELCANFLWPLNDRHFVMPLEPRYVAFLLRDYDALLDARCRVATERFEALHAPRLRLIETRYLPLFDAELIRAARAMIPTLPPAPLID
jgi:hypothetical protein